MWPLYCYGETDDTQMLPISYNAVEVAVLVLKLLLTDNFKYTATAIR